METFQSFLGDFNESKSPLNPVLSKVNTGPVFEVGLGVASEEQFANFAAQLEAAGMKSIKRFVIGLVGLSTLCGAPAQAEKWVYVTQRNTVTNNGTVVILRYYIDVDSLDHEFNDGSIRIWQKEEAKIEDNDEPEKGGPFSRYHFYCAKKEMQLLQWERFSEDWALNPIEKFVWDSANSPEVSGEARTQSVLAGSVSEEIFKAACALEPLP